MRKRIYEKEKFVHSSYSIVSRYGFEDFTVKKLATNMQISTQPIYNHFENFQDLKDEVVIELHRNAVRYIERKQPNEVPLYDYPVKMLLYYLKNPTIYQASWEDVNGNPKLMDSLFEAYFLDKLMTNEFRDFDENEKKVLYRKMIMCLLGLYNKMNHSSEREYQTIRKTWVQLMEHFISD